jgi:glycosyltransferase involved in cell wall biosynthesis
VNVHLLSYVDPYGGGQGGGEAMLRTLLEAGAGRGHRIVRTHMLPRPVFESLRGVDLVLMADVWNVPGHRRRLHRRMAGHLPGSAHWRYHRRVRRAGSVRYVHLDNAYVDICDLPYLPCNGTARGPRCPFKDGGRGACFAHGNAGMYEHADQLVFVSPLHRETVLARLERPDLIGQSTVCRPLVDPQPLRRAAGRSQGREIERLYLGPINEAKGLEEMRQTLGLETIHAVGRAGDRHSAAAADAFAELRPPVPPADVPDLLASARAVVTLPRWPEPQGRVALEAVLAGCELIANERVGALSFELRPDDDRLYEGAADDFWSGLEGLLT